MFKSKKRVRALMLAVIVTLLYTMFGYAEPGEVLSTATVSTSATVADTTASASATSAAATGKTPRPAPLADDDDHTTGPHSDAGKAEAAAKVQQDAHNTLPKVLVTLMLILMVAKIGGDLMERIGQPSVLGELLFGIILGNLALLHLPGSEFINGIFHDEKVALFITLLSELGVILLLFEVGLESTVREMLSVGPSALMVAILGVVAPIGLGYLAGIMFLPNDPWTVHLFLGAVLAATSVGITARVLKDLGKMEMRESKIILGAAVIDDILGLVVLAVAVSAVAAANAGNSMDISSIMLIVVKAVGFFVVAIGVGMVVSPKMYKLATFLQVKGVLLSLTLGWCFFVAWIGSLVGVAPIVGAFAAGLVLEDATFKDWHGRDMELEDLLRPITAFLVPVFFVHTGMNVQLSTFGNVSILGFAATLTVFALIGKQICSLGVFDKSLNKLAIGIGMIPRGEVGLIVANIGRGLKDTEGKPVVSTDTFSAAVIMVVITTMVTPPALKWALGRKPTDGAGNGETEANAGA